MILTQLLPHQKEGVNKYLKSSGIYAFMWTVGTGKSLVALACADRIKARRILITSDKNNTLNTWPGQIAEHTSGINYVVRPKTIHHCFGYNRVAVCINYDFIGSCSWLKDIPFDMWVGDESGDFKDQRTSRFSALWNTVNKIPHKIILNAEPMTERLEDLFGQFKMLDGGVSLGKTLTQFRLRYMQLDPTGYGWVPQRSAYSRIRKATSYISDWIVNRPDLKLPKKIYNTVRVPMTSEQMWLDNELKEWFAAELEDAKIETNYAPVIFTKRIQLMGGVFKGKEEKIRHVKTNKLEVLRELIRTHPESKVVVWHHYIEETKLLIAVLKNMNVFVYVDPKDPKPLEQFRDATKGVMLIRTSMCKGLNQLADGDMCIFYSHPYSFRQRMQAVGRTCRLISKHNMLTIIDLVTEGGTDEIVHHMLTQKKNFSLALSSIRTYSINANNGRKD